jgi:hypothetical protein
MVGPLHIKSPYDQANMFSCRCFPYFQQLHKLVIQDVLIHHKIPLLNNTQLQVEFDVTSTYGILLYCMISSFFVLYCAIAKQAMGRDCTVVLLY